GGEFEFVWAQVGVHDGGRFVAVELFELEDLDVARARFEALRPDPTRIPPNAASRVRDRTRALSAARDWDGLRALVADDFLFDERRRRGLLQGGVDLWIESMKQFTGPATTYDREIVGTFGDRVALDRLAWHGADGMAEGVRWEGETLRLTEVDAE